MNKDQDDKGVKDGARVSRMGQGCQGCNVSRLLRYPQISRLYQGVEVLSYVRNNIIYQD